MNDEIEPQLSIIVPAYESHSTVAACLDALAAQTWSDFELILVDSGPSSATAETVEAGYPWVRYLRSPRRLLSQSARAMGLESSRAGLILCCDSDIYPTPEFVAELLAAHQRTGRPVTGALACFGDAWLNRGIHLCKFSKWLPAGSERSVDVAPTAALLLRREQLMAAGGFVSDGFIGDVTLSWRLAGSHGGPLFVPTAVAMHDHRQSFRAFLWERYSRGIRFGILRAREKGLSRLKRWTLALAGILPLRLATNLYHVARHAARAGRLEQFFATLPVIAVGFVASLAGESIGILRRNEQQPGSR